MNFETKEISSRERLALQMPLFLNVWIPSTAKDFLNFKHTRMPATSR